VIDIHSHLLPGVDDGPARVREAVEMARIAWESGTHEMVCTPHMIAGYPTTPAQVANGVDHLRAELMRAKVPLQIHTGAEISLTWLERMTDDALRRSSIGGGGRWLLLELPFQGWPIDLAAVLNDLEIRGFTAVLAHPERAESVQRSPDRLRDAVGHGALVQITAGSLTGDHGHLAQRAAVSLLRNEWVHVIASDAHSATWRPPGMADGLQAAAAALRVEPGAISWMVEEVPRALIAGEAVRPPRRARPEAPRESARPVAPGRGGRSRG
jgi:protein-tyrosine phosphatase